jgi:hypothetical protein
MSRSFYFALATVVACGACSSSPSTNGTTTGTGGGTNTKPATGGGTASSSSAGTGGHTGTGGAGTGGSSNDGGAQCSDPTNPLFTSCIVTFLAGCWAPDLSGTCTDMNGTVAWSDGSKYVTQGAMPGLYGPGETTPCISITTGTNTITGKKGTQTLVYTYDPSTMTAKIDCPDGTSFTATSAQLTAFNKCKGLNCP